jgi:hypothetical protein
MRERLLQRFTVTSFVEDKARRGRIGKAVDQIAPPDFIRAEIERSGGLVHQPFHGKGDDRTRNAAIGRHGAGVGGDAAGAAGIGAHVIGPRHFRHGHQRFDATRRRKARIGADIGDDVGSERDELAIGIERAVEADMLIAAVERGD